MQAAELQRLSELFDHVLATHDDFAAQFYAALSEDHPELIETFQRINMRSQHARFTGMLSILLHRISDQRPIQSLLADLGEHHAMYGVKEEDFDKFGKTLQKILQRLSGNKLDDRLQEAWINAYGQISHSMRKALKASRTG